MPKTYVQSLQHFILEMFHTNSPSVQASVQV